MAASQLGLYNRTLRLMGERRLELLTDNVPPRYHLDDVWAEDPIRSCLEQGQWNWASNTVKMTYDPSIEPDFGYRRGFPVLIELTDFVRITALSSDEYFNEPLQAFRYEGGVLYCDLDDVYMSYVSDDASFGRNYSIWPQTFYAYVAGYMAFEAAPSIIGGKRALNGSTTLEALEKQKDKLLQDAQEKDAVSSPTKFMPAGTWTRARHGRQGVYNTMRRN